MAGGRPSKYKPEFAEQASKLCRLGATDRDLADFFKVSERSIRRWELSEPEFCQAIKRSKDELDAQVEQSLFRRAMGYSHPSEKVFMFQGQIVRAETVEHYPPETAAMAFWLKNRQPSRWRDKAPDNPDSNTVIVIRGGV